MRRDDWTRALVLAGAMALAGAACHDLTLTELRCSTAGRCPSGYVCGSDDMCRRTISDGSGRVAGPPGSKKQGEPCGAPGDCESAHCADGVCCDSACTDA